MIVDNLSKALCSTVVSVLDSIRNNFPTPIYELTAHFSEERKFFLDMNAKLMLLQVRICYKDPERQNGF